MSSHEAVPGYSLPAVAASPSLSPIGDGAKAWTSGSYWDDIAPAILAAGRERIEASH